MVPFLLIMLHIHKHFVYFGTVILRCVWCQFSVVLSEVMLSNVVCAADIPLHIGIRQTSDDGSPIVVSQPDSAQVN